MPAHPRILIAPLNWGLGHATRCIPIINALLAKNCEVVIAASERPYHLLKQEFPQLTHIYFPNYEVEYPEGENMAVTILRKSPEMFWETIKENRRLQELVWEHNIKGIIADNRFGFYHRRVPTVFLAHQLNLHMTEGFAWLKPFADAANLSYARRFSRMWIPDFEDADNLTGSLSHFTGLPRQARYVGPLSRFMGMEHIPGGNFGYDVLITMSGPEPQRTYLENKLTEQAKQLPLKTLLVVGKTEDGNEKIEVSQNVHKVSHLSTPDMLNAMLSAKHIVCRSGYSTIMDLCALGLKAAFIPTPGQPEQEFLAQQFKEKGLANYHTQADVELSALLENYNNYGGFTNYKPNSKLLDFAIDDFLLLVEQQS